MRILVTGADGFIGRNLLWRLAELGYDDVNTITRATASGEISGLIKSADFIFHLAGVNRPDDIQEFAQGNAGLTAQICDLLLGCGAKTPLLLASSSQAPLDTPYGQSKRAAEDAVRRYARDTGAAVYVYRMVNVFGKWARPNYNSAVATFCHNIARGLSIHVNDPSAPLRLLHIDDVVARFTDLLKGVDPGGEIGPVYETTVGEVADMIRAFADSRQTMVSPPVGTGLTRALYATYMSYLPQDAFSYEVPRHGDARGVFVEMLKTPDCGQFSYFTALPGVTRGEHYHHSKTEKFLVIKGEARFGFRHIVTGERCEIITRGGEGRIVETPPGWTHNISNIGDSEMIVMLWANEIFDRARPDTVAMKVVS